MIPKIIDITPQPDYVLSVLFDDGKRVLYDVKQDMRDIPGYRVLESVQGLFRQVMLDQSRTCVYWNEDVDLPSDIIYEYGKPAGQ